jgi:transcription initiation factor TFIIIB Brf1 subunit/transcription initiation factor TFIIB
MSRKVTVIEHGTYGVICPECKSESVGRDRNAYRCMSCQCVFKAEDVPDKTPEPTPEEIFFDKVKGKKIVYTGGVYVPGIYATPVKMRGPNGFEDTDGRVWAIIDPTIPGPLWDFYKEPEPEPLKMAKLLGVKFVGVGEPLPDFEPVQCVKPRASITLRNAADWTDDEAREIANWMRRTGMKMLKERKEYDKRFKATFH